MTSKSWLQFLQKELDNLRLQERYRTLKKITSSQDTQVEIDGRPYLAFCSNNYLGLANHPRLSEAAAREALKHGWGGGASRLISGHMQAHQELEAAVASFKGCGEALVFPTGFMANTGTVSALTGEKDALIIDRANHASIIDGCRQSKARLLVYPHRDPAGLEKILRRGKDRYDKMLVITDSVFSMDGDIAPLPEITALCEKHDALLMIDEAHATGVLGNNGKGAMEFFGLEENKAGIIMGTLSKAVGSLGGFVAGDRILTDYLRNRARSFIYTTALPPPVCAASLEGLRLIKEEGWRRQKLRDNVTRLKEGLERLGYPPTPDPTPIIPLIIGKEKDTLRLARYLFDKGLLVPPIRPPTVPQNTCRLRITVMAAHTRQQIDTLLEALKKY